MGGDYRPGLGGDQVEEGVLLTEGCHKFLGIIGAGYMGDGNPLGPDLVRIGQGPVQQALEGSVPPAADFFQDGEAPVHHGHQGMNIEDIADKGADGREPTAFMQKIKGIHDKGRADLGHEAF